jgi:hypothetical protein
LFIGMNSRATRVPALPAWVARRSKSSWVDRLAVALGGDLDRPSAEDLGGVEQQGAPLIRDPAPLVGGPPPGQDLQLDVLDPCTVEDAAQLRQADGVPGDRQVGVQKAEALPADLGRGLDPGAQVDRADLVAAVGSRVSGRGPAGGQQLAVADRRAGRHGASLGAWAWMGMSVGGVVTALWVWRTGPAGAGAR